MSRPHRARNIALALYIAALHALVVILLVKTDTYDRFAEWMNWPEDVTNERFYRAAHQNHLRQVQTIESHQTVFIGDSHIAGLNNTLLDPTSLNFGLGGDSLKGALTRLEAYLDYGTPATVVLGAGTNDIPFFSAQYIAKQLDQYLPSITHIERIYILAVLPVTKEHELRLKRPLVKSQALNTQLKHRASSNKNLVYISLPHNLLDENGYLKPSLHAGDGLHLNQNGYRIWQQHIQHIMKQQQ